MSADLTITFHGAEGKRTYALNFDALPKGVLHEVILSAMSINALWGDGRIVLDNENDRAAEKELEDLASAINLMESYAKLVPGGAA